MNNNELVNINRINFIKVYFMILGKVILLLLSAFLFSYVIANENMQLYIKNNIFIALVFICFFLVIVFIQQYYNGSTFIYYFSIVNDDVNINWQKNSKFYELTLKLKNVEVELMPSGKNTFYLKFQLNSDKVKLILNQTVYDDWSEKDMKIFLLKFKEFKNGNV